MDRSSPSDQIAAYFRRWQADPGRWGWLRRWCDPHHALPVFADMFDALAIQPDGTVLRIWTEGLAFRGAGSPAEVSDAEAVEVVHDTCGINLALYQGMIRHPELAEVFRALLPPRPADAVECRGCGGTGRLPDPFVCACGGTGWMPNREAPPNGQ